MSDNTPIIREDGRVPAWLKYRHSLGIEGKGIHSYRFFGFAIADILQTIFGFGILSYFLGVPLWKGILGGFVLGIVLHRAFGVRTTLDKLLFD